MRLPSAEKRRSRWSGYGPQKRQIAALPADKGTTVRRANVVSGVVLALFGLAMLVAILPWQIEPGPDGMMSPRLVPYLMMAVITGLSVLLVANNSTASAREQEEDATPPVSRAEMMALLKIGAIFALAIVLYQWVSPVAAGISLTAGTLLALGERRPTVIVLMPVALLTALWFLLYKLLGTKVL